MGSSEFAEMVIKVRNLSCRSCYKEVDKILHKFPEIRDRSYDERARTVAVTVNCNDPASLRDRLIHKGKGYIQHIEIKESRKKRDEKIGHCSDLSTCCHGQLSYAPPCHGCYRGGDMPFEGSCMYGGRCYYYRGFGTCLRDENTQGCIIM